MSPKGDTMSPKGDTMSPKGDTWSPKGDTMSPKGDTISPKGDTMSPKGDTMSPKGDTMSPKGDTMSPKGDTISPKLFTATVESIFRKLTLEKRYFRRDGEYFSHLRFPICPDTWHELQKMLRELDNEYENQGLKMNDSKTKAML